MYEKPKRYVPGPGEPALPPQLSEFQNKTTDEVLDELNRMPFFMKTLDDTDGEGGENVKLEALKALAYDGEPHEVAENFKNQGNDLYKVKRYREARELYNKGVEIECNVAGINESLYSNRAACELELNNFRRCINDCKLALQINPQNIKCYYRVARAFHSLGNYDEAKQTLEFGLQLDPGNAALNALQAKIIQREEERKAYEANKLKEQKERERLKTLLDASLILRNFKNIDTVSPPELLNEAKLYLEDKQDVQSQLIFPAMVFYPTSDEFDFIATVGELSTPEDLLGVLLQRPKEWFDQPIHKDFTPKKLVGYMETEAGGLIKIGKKVNFHEVLKMQKPVVPLFDRSLRIYFVPKNQSEDWLSRWDKTEALKKR
ncbi:LANO_0E09692g1_1 [Lachancea nothofagi CBS 11611]|uniref:LANO_0E09692g1_1 n=1 Tax=Lachancea nothofagi CBS 11611 TaxID=1266666 RepID=A0A1G4JW68_9SACH|nr:LANO_0E09692g1_1 [Lachancea nothofagi CBS 11611]